MISSPVHVKHSYRTVPNNYVISSPTSTVVSGGCLITGKGIATSYYMGNIIKADGNGKDTTLKNQFTDGNMLRLVSIS